MSHRVWYILTRQSDTNLILPSKTTKPHLDFKKTSHLFRKSNAFVQCAHIHHMAVAHAKLPLPQAYKLDLLPATRFFGFVGTIPESRFETPVV